MLVAYRSHSLCEIVRQRQRIYDWHAAGQLRPLRLKALSTLLDRFCSKLLMVCQKSLQGWSVVKYVPQQSLFLRFIDNCKPKFVLFVVMQACFFSLNLQRWLGILNFKVLAKCWSSDYLRILPCRSPPRFSRQSKHHLPKIRIHRAKRSTQRSVSALVWPCASSAPSSDVEYRGVFWNSWYWHSWSEGGKGHWSPVDSLNGRSLATRTGFAFVPNGHYHTPDSSRQRPTSHRKRIRIGRW